MTKQPDQSFFRNLVLHCLDYVPNAPDDEGTMMDHPDTKTFQTIRSAVNVVRSDHYSWLLASIRNIPEEDLKRHDRLAAQIRCLSLSDKKEELLLSCSVLVQIAHFTVMQHKCLESVDSAARALSKTFDEKYRDSFNDGWAKFERHCEAKSDAPTTKADDDTVDSAVRKETAPWCKTANEKSVLDFWDKKELKKLVQVAEEEKEAFKKRSTVKLEKERGEKIIVIRAYNSMLKSKIDEYDHPLVEARKSDPGWKKCHEGFCLGCFLTVAYPEAKKDKPRVKHNMFCQLWTDKRKDSIEKLRNLIMPRERDLCATEIPRLPEVVLNFVQKHLDLIFGTCVLKDVRNKVFRELDVDVETCTLCEKQCMRKLIVCMDLYLGGCRKRREKSLI